MPAHRPDYRDAAARNAVKLAPRPPTSLGSKRVTMAVPEEQTEFALYLPRRSSPCQPTPRAVPPSRIIP